MLETPNDSALLARLDERTIAIQRDLTEMKSSFNSWDSRILKLEQADAVLPSKFVRTDSPEARSIERWEKFEQRLTAYAVMFGVILTLATYVAQKVLSKYLGL